MDGSDWSELGLSLPKHKEASRPEYAYAKLMSRDVEIVSSVRVPEARFGFDDQVGVKMAKGEEVLYASAVDGLSVVHKRYGAAVAVAVDMANKAEYLSQGFPYAECEVRDAMSTGCMASGGAQFTLGRLAKYLPGRARKPVEVPTLKEVEEAWQASVVGGLRPAEWVRRDDVVRVNPQAELGFPFGGKAVDELKLAQHRKLQEQMRMRLQGGDVEREYRRMLEEEPYLVLFKGKAKFDFYKASKIAGGELRFYNVLPGWLKLELMATTQAFETYVSPGPKTFQGRTLASGGSGEIVDLLESQLAEGDVAWVTCGDDSFVAVRTTHGYIALFALDCSSFDLTQNGAVTEPVHDRVRRALLDYDELDARLWHCAMRERLTTVSGSVVARFKHAGPSGMPLQSKVNDLLMQVALQRVASRLARRRYISVEDIEPAVMSAGESLGLSVRLEQLKSSTSRTVRGALAEHTFTFVGYDFRCDADGEVRAFADFPRMLKQIPYKTSQGFYSRTELEVRMALKVAGVMLAAGVPPKGLEKAFQAGLDGAKRLLEKLPVGEAHTDAIQEVLAGHVFVDLPSYLGTLRGLRGALNFDSVREIWEAKALWPSLDRPTKEVPVSKGLTRALPIRPSQIVERVGPLGAGRPPRVKRRELRATLAREARKAGGISKLPKKKRERLLYLMQADSGEDTDQGSDGEYQSEYSWGGTESIHTEDPYEWM